MYRSIASGILITALALVSVTEARVARQYPLSALVPQLATVCGCQTNFDCLYGNFGCVGAGFSCEVTPYGWGACIDER